MMHAWAAGTQFKQASTQATLWKDSQLACRIEHIAANQLVPKIMLHIISAWVQPTHYIHIMAKRRQLHCCMETTICIALVTQRRTSWCCGSWVAPSVNALIDWVAQRRLGTYTLLGWQPPEFRERARISLHTVGAVWAACLFCRSSDGTLQSSCAMHTSCRPAWGESL
jgi:hypothetical protein